MKVLLPIACRLIRSAVPLLEKNRGKKFKMTKHVKKTSS